jgi:hypothetical protein
VDAGLELYWWWRSGSTCNQNLCTRSNLCLGESQAHAYRIYGHVGPCTCFLQAQLVYHCQVCLKDMASFVTSTTSPNALMKMSRICFQQGQRPAYRYLSDLRRRLKALAICQWCGYLHVACVQNGTSPRSGLKYTLAPSPPPPIPTTDRRNAGQPYY